MADLDRVLVEVTSALDAARPSTLTSPSPPAPEDADRLLDVLRDQIARTANDPIGFARATGVLPFAHTSGVRVELILGSHPYARDAIARAVPIEVLGVAVRFCTPEDLILHKVISDRERDRGDVADLVRRRRATLDRAYLDPRVDELASLLDRPDVARRYRALFE